MMTSTHSTNENKNETKQLENLNDDVIVAIPKPELPKKARNTSCLLFKASDLHGGKRKSAHKISVVHKKVSSIKSKKKTRPSSLYFFKYNDPNSLISELESVCCAFCQFIATPNYVPNAKAYYDDKFEFVGLASKKIEDWVSNHDNPLRWDDIVIDIPSFKVGTERNQLTKILPLLIQSLDRSASKTQNSYFNFSVLQMTKNVINSHLNSMETAVNFAEEIKCFQQNPCRFDIESLEALNKKIKAREVHVTHSIKDPKYETELKLLRETQRIIKNLKDLSEKEKNKNISIRELEEIFKKLKKDDFKIEINKKKQSIFSQNLDEKAIYPTKIAGEEYEIRIKDLKNYLILRGLGTSLTTRYIFKEVDNHNSNMSKFGHIIDFDMSKFNILAKFKKMDFTTRALREPAQNTFIVTERDIRDFPNIHDADLYYWPTRQTFVSKSVVDIVSIVFDISENFFSSHDNEVYKKLANNPVFIFHKYKTFLKYLLTDKTMYSEIAKLHMRSGYTYPDGNTEKNILDEMVTDEEERISEIRKVLVKMPEFRNFLNKDGELAFQLIKEELEEYRAKYNAKLPYKPFYKPLVDSINIKNLEEKLDELYIAAGAQKTADHHVSSTRTTHL